MNEPSPGDEPPVTPPPPQKHVTPPEPESALRRAYLTIRFLLVLPILILLLPLAIVVFFLMVCVLGY